MDDPKTLSSKSTSVNESTLSPRLGEITEKETKTNATMTVAMIFVKTRFVLVGSRRIHRGFNKDRFAESLEIRIQSPHGQASPGRFKHFGPGEIFWCIN